MSEASNFGYSNIIPNSNINSNYINKDNSHYPGGFGSNEVPELSGAKYNVDAAASRIPGITGGGRKKIKRKIKNITKRYKMSKKKISSVKRKIKSKISRAIGRTRAASLARTRSLAGGRKHRKTHKRRQRGGYSQYQNNLPMTPTYSTGGILSANDLGLANPVPYKILSNDTNNIDNYNHFLGKGFSSKGH